jgi:hypothetical protein
MMRRIATDEATELSFAALMHVFSKGAALFRPGANGTISVT